MALISLDVCKFWKENVTAFGFRDYYDVFLRGPFIQLEV